MLSVHSLSGPAPDFGFAFSVNLLSRQDPARLLSAHRHLPDFFQLARPLTVRAAHVCPRVEALKTQDGALTVRILSCGVLVTYLNFVLDTVRWSLRPAADPGRFLPRGSLAVSGEGRAAGSVRPLGVQLQTAFTRGPSCSGRLTSEDARFGSFQSKPSPRLRGRGRHHSGCGEERRTLTPLPGRSGCDPGRGLLPAAGGEGSGPKPARRPRPSGRPLWRLARPRPGDGRGWGPSPPEARSRKRGPGSAARSLCLSEELVDTDPPSSSSAAGRQRAAN